MTTYQFLLYTIDQSVATIRLNRPEKRNALTPEMLTELYHAVDAAGADSSVRAIVIAAEGPTFCAGQDLSIFTGKIQGQAVRDAVLQFYKPLILHMVELPKPIVGAINGGAAGAGASLALACDLRIMADDSYLLQAFSTIGLVPDAGSTWFMARLVGHSRAFQLCIEAERIAAAHCLELGLCNRVVPAADLQIEAQAWAQKLSQRPTSALGWTKQAIAAALANSLEESIDLEAELQAKAVETHDHKEGVMAFLQKRAPQFTGE